MHGPSLSCNSSGKAIAILRDCRAYSLARWHRFVSIAHREPLQTALQGTFARAMISRKITKDQRPATHGPQSPVSARTLAFLQFTWHPNQPSRALQGTSARAMISRKTTGRPRACHARPSETGWCPVPHFPAIHLARQSPFHGPPGHIRSRDGIDLCPSSAANPSRQHSRAYPLAR